METEMIKRVSSEKMETMKTTETIRIMEVPKRRNVWRKKEQLWNYGNQF